MSTFNPYQPPQLTSHDLQARPVSASYRPLGILRGLVVGLLVLTVLVTAAEFIAGGVLRGMLSGIVDGSVSEQQADDVIAHYQLLSLAGAALLAITCVPFFMLLYRISNNLRALDADNMQFTPGWVIGWFFVPLCNLYYPYRAVLELWTASADDGDAFAFRTPPMLPLWWIGHLASGVLVRLGASIAGDEPSIAEMATAMNVELAGTAVYLISAVSLIVLIQALCRRVERRAAQTRAFG